MFILITGAIVGVLTWPINRLVRAFHNIPLDTELWEDGEYAELQRIRDRETCEAILAETSRRAHPSYRDPK
jgi:hypothetical protein